MLSSGCPGCFIFRITSHYNHLENVWSGLAANSELYFARLQNDSPTVQDCHWYTSMFCPVSSWTQCHIQSRAAVESFECAHSADNSLKKTICSINDGMSYKKTVYRLSPLFAWDLLFVRHAPLTVNDWKQHCTVITTKPQWIYTSDWKMSVILL